MPDRAGWRRGAPWWLALALSLTALAGCQEGANDRGAVGQSRLDTASLQITELWEQPTISWGPGEVSGRWWLTSVEQPVAGSVHAADQRQARLGRTEIGDATTGIVTPVRMPGRVCEVHGLASEGDSRGRFLVATQRRGDATCRLGLYDAETRAFVWQRLLGAAERTGAAGAEVVTLVGEPADAAGASEVVGCLDLDDGAELSLDDDRCAAGDPADGDVGPATLVGEWRGVRVVTTAPVPAADGSGHVEPGTVRGIDGDGDVVWEGPVIDHRDGASWLFDWTDQVLATDWGPVLVSYDFGPAPSVPDLGDQPDATLTPLDPVTGELLTEIATLTDSNVRWIVDDVLLVVAGGGYVSTWSGQQLVRAPATVADQ